MQPIPVSSPFRFVLAWVCLEVDRATRASYKVTSSFHIRVREGGGRTRTRTLPNPTQP
jgi:hypothetical protein